MTPLTLDAGALIAFERGDRATVLAIEVARRRRLLIAVPAGVLGQAWRDGRRQARLARLLAFENVVIDALDEDEARAAGQLCGAVGTSDVIDASVVLSARRHGAVVLTSDPDDIAKLDDDLEIVEV